MEAAEHIGREIPAEVPGPVDQDVEPTVLQALRCGDVGRQYLPGAPDGDGSAVTVTGPLTEISAYLAGRHHGATTAEGAAVPTLPAWL
ncbi:hypothetical protein OG223_48550 [Streptomyces sp. NBC_01478]|uniref:hypothetical protein n=1 Tax=Streptomyces sp. NBC_01478 TaxID=2903882 RepID=UPI002E330096|nr:hypothetical protein [Streptomyces sp. NBC_01478]